MNKTLLESFGTDYSSGDFTLQEISEVFGSMAKEEGITEDILNQNMQITFAALLPYSDSGVVLARFDNTVENYNPNFIDLRSLADDSMFEENNMPSEKISPLYSELLKGTNLNDYNSLISSIERSSVAGIAGVDYDKASSNAESIGTSFGDEFAESLDIGLLSDDSFSKAVRDLPKTTGISADFLAIDGEVSEIINSIYSENITPSEKILKMRNEVFKRFAQSTDTAVAQKKVDNQYQTLTQEISKALGISGAGEELLNKIVNGFMKGEDMEKGLMGSLLRFENIEAMKEYIGVEDGMTGGEVMSQAYGKFGESLQAYNANELTKEEFNEETETIRAVMDIIVASI